MKKTLFIVLGLGLTFVVNVAFSEGGDGGLNFNDLVVQNTPVNDSIKSIKPNKPDEIGVVVGITPDALAKLLKNRTLPNVLNPSVDLSKSVLVIKTSDNNKTIQVNTAIQFDTTILLPQGDAVETFSIRHTQAFDIFVPTSKNSNKLILNSKFINATSNLTVFGKSGLVYSFYLKTVDPKSKTVHFVVRFEHALKKIMGFKKDEKPDYFASLKTLNLNKNLDLTALKRLNFNYAFKNNKLPYPVDVFDDGVFTYFVLGDQDKNPLFNGIKIPGIYESIKGFDHVVSTEVLTNLNLLIVKKVSKQWTIRESNAMGEDNPTLCIKNENY